MQRNLSSCKRHISLPSVSTQSHLSTEAPHPLTRCCRTSQQPRHIQTTLWEEEEPQVISVDDAAPALPPRVSPWGGHAHFIWPRPCPRDSGSRSRASRFMLGAAHTPSPTGPGIRAQGAQSRAPGPPQTPVSSAFPPHPSFGLPWKSPASGDEQHRASRKQPQDCQAPDPLLQPCFPGGGKRQCGLGSRSSAVTRQHRVS